MSIFALTRPLLDGSPVALRLARSSDARALRVLLESCGVTADPLEIGRLLRFDPWSRAVLCAVTPEGIVGVGAMDLAPGAEPDTLVCAAAGAPGVGALLVTALHERARVHGLRTA